jgi:hypothetical protein
MLVNLRTRRSVDLVVVVGACKATDTTEAVAEATTPGMASISNRLCLDWISAMPIGIGTPFRGDSRAYTNRQRSRGKAGGGHSNDGARKGRQVSESDKDSV